jgi:hypothetical protein
MTVTAGLPTRARLALIALALDHQLPLYRLGKVKLLAGDLAGKLSLQPGDDLVDWGIAALWRYVREGTHDADAVAAVVEAGNAVLKSVSKDKLAKAGLGAGYGLTSGLRALNGVASQLDNALVRVVGGVFYLFDALSDDENAAAVESRRENTWQTKVARRLAELGPDAPLEREHFADLLAERLPWHDYLERYAEAVGGKV